MFIKRNFLYIILSIKINERQSEIVKIVEKNGKVLVKDLSKMLNISEVTIRKDLNLLDEYGILIREHGFASKKNSADILNRLSINYEIKKKIAKKACDLLGENETVIIGSGSTCALLTEEISRFKPNVTIITHSLYIASHVKKIGNNKIILLGGEYQKDAQVLVGPLVRSSIKQFYVDKIFLGTDGFIKKAGFMGSDSLRTEAVMNMSESARKIIILTDSSKFNKRGLLVQFRVNQIYQIISDDNLPREYKDYFSLYNIILTLVS